MISIADDGNGISDEAKKKVFDMFYSGENKVADSGAAAESACPYASLL